jgi:hypothetical protein
MKTNKTQQVLNHLIAKGKIDTWKAIELYGATRLSAIIYTLRNRGYQIDTIDRCVLDRNSNVCNYAEYILINDENLLP